MPYVQRDAGTIVALYAVMQPGFAEEWLEEGDAEVESFLNPEPEPVEAEPKRIACALHVPLINDEVQEIGGAFRIPGMIFLDTGTFLAIFSRNLGSQQPYVIPNNGVSVSIQEWGEEYAIMEVRDHAGGSLITPSSFGFSLYSF